MAVVHQGPPLHEESSRSKLLQLGAIPDTISFPIHFLCPAREGAAAQWDLEGLNRLEIRKRPGSLSLRCTQRHLDMESFGKVEAKGGRSLVSAYLERSCCFKAKSLIFSRALHGCDLESQSDDDTTCSLRGSLQSFQPRQVHSRGRIHVLEGLRLPFRSVQMGLQPA